MLISRIAEGVQRTIRLLYTCRLANVMCLQSRLGPAAFLQTRFSLQKHSLQLLQCSASSNAFVIQATALAESRGCKAELLCVAAKPSGDLQIKSMKQPLACMHVCICLVRTFLELLSPVLRPASKVLSGLQVIQLARCISTAASEGRPGSTCGPPLSKS